MKVLTRILFIALFPILISSCTDDDLLPGNDDNTNDLAAKYLGTWHVYEPDKKLNYDVTITRKGNSDTYIILNNFASVGNATGLCTENSVVIEQQKLTDDYTVEGSGDYINKKKMTFTFTLNDGIEEEVRNATFTRE